MLIPTNYLLSQKIIKTAFFAVAVVAAGFGSVKTYNLSHVHESRLVSENVEALSSAGEFNTGFTLFKICSKHDGNVFCSERRGNRRWVVDVTFTVGASLPDYDGYEDA